MNLLNAPAFEYQFEQLVYLLETHFPEKFEHLSFRPDASMTFPGSDVRAIEQDTQGHLTLLVRFMGLFGVDSPLPNYFNDLTLNDSDSAERWRSYLSLLTSHQYRLFYQAWRLSQLHLNVNSPDSTYRRYLAALSGGALTKHDQIAYGQTSHLMRGAMSFSDLMIALKQFLPKTYLEVKELQPHCHRISHKPVLGQDRQELGSDTLLGYRIMSQISSILIKIKPFETESIKKYLPDGEIIQKTVDFLRRFLPGHMHYQMEILLKPRQSSAIKLGNNSLRLSWTFWLGKTDEKIYSLNLTL